MKPWYKSRTIWVNLIAVAVAVLGSPEVLAIIPPSGMVYVPGIVVALNIVLRVFFTGTKIGKVQPPT